MHLDWDNIERGDRERLLGQLIRMERDLQWRLLQQGLDADGNGPPGNTAALHKRLSFLLRSTRARIAAARDEVAALTLSGREP